MTWSFCVSSNNRCFPWPVTAENMRSQSNWLLEPWLSFWNSVYQLSDIGPMIRHGLALEPYKNLKTFQHIYEGLTNIHAKFQHTKTCNVWATIFLVKLHTNCWIIRYTMAIKGPVLFNSTTTSSQPMAGPFLGSILDLLMVSSLPAFKENPMPWWWHTWISLVVIRLPMLLNSWLNGSTLFWTIS